MPAENGALHALLRGHGTNRDADEATGCTGRKLHLPVLV